MVIYFLMLQLYRACLALVGCLSTSATWAGHLLLLLSLASQPCTGIYLRTDFETASTPKKPRGVVPRAPLYDDQIVFVLLRSPSKGHYLLVSLTDCDSMRAKGSPLACLRVLSPCVAGCQGPVFSDIIMQHRQFHWLETVNPCQQSTIPDFVLRATRPTDLNLVPF